MKKDFEDYKVIEHIADTGLRVFGDTKVKLFQNAARGMFFIITGHSLLAKPESSLNWTIKCEGSDTEGLLVEWLSELLYIHSVNFVILDDFIIKSMSIKGLESLVRGIKVRESPYNIEKEIKAVTYHNLQVLKNKNGQWEANIIFDI